ncbi:hypothetical protein AV530_009425 [Patagioenas fasciata monilis]|uniref:Uncharacterized protein n=1 Tax=Patagioenas fasciata monilis TaxID=372326 RepID=A0A1V4JK49_PATFA|nr:hypothetical protein AV530_009425 [Patagioenas fasciata monilis]
MGSQLELLRALPPWLAPGRSPLYLSPGQFSLACATLLESQDSHLVPEEVCGSRISWRQRKPPPFAYLDFAKRTGDHRITDVWILACYGQYFNTCKCAEFSWTTFFSLSNMVVSPLAEPARLEPVLQFSLQCRLLRQMSHAET